MRTMQGRKTLFRALVACAAVAIVLPSDAVAAPAETRNIVSALAQRDYLAARQWAARASDGALRTFVDWSLLRHGPDQDFASYARFLDAHPQWPDGARLQVRAENAIGPQVSSGELLRFFTGREPRTEGGGLALLDALYLAGERERAAKLVRRLWVENDLDPQTEAEILARHAPSLGPADHVARTDRLLWDERVTAAERMLPFLPPGKRAVAEARIVLQRNGRGVDGALAAVPSSEAGDPGLVIDRVRWHKKRGSAVMVDQLLLQQVSGEPLNPREWWAERGGAARDAMDERDYRRAYQLASRHGLSDGSEFAEGEWLAGWLALRFLNDPARAFAHFERFSAKVGTPISRARGAYWAGRAKAAAGDPAGAGLWYGRAAAHPTAFYGQLATAELGKPLRFDGLSPSPPDPAARAQFRRDELVRVSEELCAAGAREEVTPFLRQLGDAAATEPETLERVYDLARRCARPDLVVVVAKAAVRDGAESLATFPIPDVASMLSPAPGRPPPQAILAIARQESQFDPGAVSRSGARGLMQLMPTTGREVARRLGLPFDLQALNDDPDFNIQLGSWYLGRQLDRFDGSLALAAAAYNAGPGRVNEWIGRFGDPRGRPVHELVDWIELIPFSETRNYVQRILEGEAVYAALLDGGGRPPSTAPWRAPGHRRPSPLGRTVVSWSAFTLARGSAWLN